MKRSVVLTCILLGAVCALSACNKEPEKTVISATLIPSPSPIVSVATPIPELDEEENSEIKNEKLTDEQEEVAAIFFDNLIGEFLGLPYDTSYYNISVGDKYEIVGDDCYQITVLNPDDNSEVGKYYVSLSGEAVYAYDETKSGYYSVYNEEETLGSDDDNNEAADEAKSMLRTFKAEELGLPSSINMEDCIIEYDSMEDINGKEYFCFFISKDDSFSSYFEYYVSTDYTSLLIYDDNAHKYYDLYAGQYITEDDAEE